MLVSVWVLVLECSLLLGVGVFAVVGFGVGVLVVVVAVVLCCFSLGGFVSVGCGMVGALLVVVVFIGCGFGCGCCGGVVVLVFFFCFFCLFDEDVVVAHGRRASESVCVLPIPELCSLILFAKCIVSPICVILVFRQETRIYTVSTCSPGRSTSIGLYGCVRMSINGADVV